MSPDQILAELAERRRQDLPTHGGRTLAYVYDSGLAAADEVGRQALIMYASANGLDPTAFPSLLSMEADLVAFARRHLHAGDEVVGTVTSGGTESILLAVQTARDAAGVERPAMVVPSTIHAAFAKAAHYFGVELVAVPVGAEHRADVPAMTEAIDTLGDRVVLVAASTPSYAHGVIDPIEELAAVTRARGLRLHVDACIGGWILPWTPDAAPWDFAVPGVTSLSVDLHKYAYTPKGVSLLLHADAGLRRPQFFAYADWPGYTMLNSTMQSTKSGGPLAAAWAVVNLIGSDGYRGLVEHTLAGTRALADGIEAIDHLHLVERPDTSLVAVGTDDAVDVFTISDLMLDRGWFVQPQMRFGDEPANLHLTISAATADSVPEFLTALREAVDEAALAGPVRIDPALAEAAATLDPDTPDDEAFDGLLALAGLAGGDGQVAVPDRLGPVNALVDVAPPRVREALMVAFLDRLTR
ncbi:pyridoxal phosphate-dependent decarboxylase family protein [Aeromicrobium duanguangcaii]|uniref:Aspartate aminotransferase family protein n=1 Tax=Aeromicrobium duanguangcaii TaxID=2968086 RepID=A0ABY5KE36_9ACTN|nr:aspartate aminotransferase family protein [Aeromicrobium duanguangcaii]MCD9155204.1 aspartate aminotransferase family protein [Aeromicrobium duanguangcaii]UUI68145.1 aspartate aminotransferase family protein [Aeromicrobium duanguangcaii]